MKLLHSKYDQHAAPGAAARVTGTSLRHPELMTNTPVHTQICVLETEMLTVMRCRESSDTGAHELPLTKNCCTTTVCAYALQKQACEMSHDYDISLVQCHLSVFSFHSDLFVNIGLN